MNPFDLPGPAFLAFYLALSVVVIVALVVSRLVVESSAAPKLDLSDPYLIAYLRGSEFEVLRVAVVSLVDRSLLITMGTQLRRAEHASPSSVRRPIEAELLRKFANADEATSIYTDLRLQEACRTYEQTLKNAGLLPNEQINRARLIRLLLACLVLGGAGLVKIVLALASGRTNVVFLVILMIIAIVVAGKISFPRLTESGKAMIGDLQNLYEDLKGRALLMQPGGATIEPMMLAAVFGVGALEASGFAFTRVIFPQATRNELLGSSGTAYACNSVSSGSSSGSSCGSSCGGGGCGGGCGGCGG
jgi:uncharacterized protein (TIGR04222 family)